MLPASILGRAMDKLLIIGLLMACLVNVLCFCAYL
jgi:hypothetical protein